LIDINNFSNKALLVHIDKYPIDINNSKEEFQDLVGSANIEFVDKIFLTQKNKNIGIKYYIGKGDAESVKEEVRKNDAKLVIFNVDLSPSQERNLELLFSARVLDRTGLILDIFSQRAFSHEGKLQVELAQLNYLSTRLVRGWSHLERQKGGIGLRGPGETQLETDRRLLRARIKTIKKRLVKVSNQRQLSRNLRLKHSTPRISIVGYTNAGKSTLFNFLTDMNTLAENKLFATLDPIHRKLELEYKKNAVISDTVGFIRELPHHLIESFKSTLSEVAESNLLLHVIDLSDDNFLAYIEEVNNVLESIGAKDIPKILVFNKIDQNYNPENFTHLEKDSFCYVSAKTGYGVENLRKIISEKIFEGYEFLTIKLSSNQGEIRSSIYENCNVIEDIFEKSGHNTIKFMANHSYMKYLVKKGLIERKVIKSSKNSQEIYKTG
jgi:GTP-binding protein HflX